MSGTWSQGNQFSTWRWYGDSNTVEDVVIVRVYGDSWYWDGEGSLGLSKGYIKRTGVLEDFRILVAISGAKTTSSVGVGNMETPL